MQIILFHGTGCCTDTNLKAVSSSQTGGASNDPELCMTSSDYITSSARVAILFSGGIDSTVIAALADK